MIIEVSEFTVALHALAHLDPPESNLLLLLRMFYGESICHHTSTGYFVDRLRPTRVSEPTDILFWHDSGRSSLSSSRLCLPVQDWRYYKTVRFLRSTG